MPNSGAFFILKHHSHDQSAATHHRAAMNFLLDSDMLTGDSYYDILDSETVVVRLVNDNHAAIFRLSCPTEIAQIITPENALDAFASFYTDHMSK